MEMFRESLMNFFSLTKFKPLLVTLGWATCTAAFTLGTIFQGNLLQKDPNGGGQLPDVVNAGIGGLLVFYVGIFLVCILAALVLADLRNTLLSLLAAYVLGAVLTTFVLSLPDYLGIYQPSGYLQGLAVGFTFGAFFPYLLFIMMAGAFLGMALAEHFM